MKKQLLCLCLALALLLASGAPALATGEIAGETSDPTTEATEPSDEATQPSDGATEPSNEATEPSDGATQPSTEATEPSGEATQPSDGATEPSNEATEPSDEATEPSDEATEPSNGATEPSSEATEPSDGATQPSGEVTEPSDGATEPTSDPLLLLAEEPVIEVIVPDAGQVIVNPYGLAVELDDETTRDQIVSVPLFLENRSSVALQVDAIVTGTAYGELLFVEDTTQVDWGDKAVFLYLELQPSDDGESASWLGEWQNEDNQLVVTEGETTREAMLTLEAGGETPTYGAFRFFGNAATRPERVWTGEDGFDISVVFRFSVVGS